MVGVVRVMNAEMVGGHIQAGKLEEDLQWIKNKLFDLGGSPGPRVQEHATGDRERCEEGGGMIA